MHVHTHQHSHPHPPPHPYPPPPSHEWTHALVCCDSEHAASASGSTSLSASPTHPFSTNSFPSVPPPLPSSMGPERGPAGHHHQCSHPHAEDEPCPMEVYCCADEYCDGHGEAADVECCADPHCAEAVDTVGVHGKRHEEDNGENGHGHGHGEIGDMDELERWACSQEGCHAIQQYLECCTETNCDLPVAPTVADSTQPTICHHHPTDTSQGGSDFDPSSFPPAPPALPGHAHHTMSFWPTTSSSLTTSASSTPAVMTPLAPMPTHVCHWQNCHQVFSSMPDLLGHVASEHLGAPGFSSLAPPPSSIPSSTANSGSTPPSNPTTLSLGQLASSESAPIEMAFASASAAETDRLLSCLWDDCFPLPPECTADVPSSCPPHPLLPEHHPPAPAHPAVHTHSHMHTHTSAQGEPFSPQTMLRHVLEEHLGVPPDILGWSAESNVSMAPPPQPMPLQQPFNTDPARSSSNSDHQHHHHHHAHIAQHRHMANAHSHGRHNHTHHHHHPTSSHSSVHLPTPPSSDASPHAYSHSRLSSHSTTPPHLLHCLWTGCPLAHEAFASPSALMDHLSEAHIGKGKDSYVCMWEGCVDPVTGQGRGFRSRQKVLRHLQSHTGHRPFQCGVCGQSFSEKAPLEAHMRRHAQEKPFKCEYPGCGKSFAISSSLTIHMRTHNGEKPFVCPHCGKGFVEASNLTKHIRTHTGERPFVCMHPGCEKRFPRPDQLKRHMLVHEEGRGRAKRARV